jgi:hypothetical protein
LDRLLTRLEAARTPADRRNVAERAQKLELERRSWFGLELSDKKHRVDDDRIPVGARPAWDVGGDAVVPGGVSQQSRSS